MPNLSMASKKVGLRKGKWDYSTLGTYHHWIIHHWVGRVKGIGVHGEWNKKHV